jgi:chaperonin GroEL
MDKRKVIFMPDSQKLLLQGADLVANAVKVTLGPKGRNVVLDTYGVPQVTKDGVTVAKFITPDEPVLALGANIIKQAAAKSGKVAGDGTTTATVLAQALIKEGLKTGASPILIKREYEHLTNYAIQMLKEMSIPITEDKLKNIATISANNDVQLGNIITAAFSKVGANGVIYVEDSKTNDTFVDVTEGFSINKGYITPVLCNDTEKMEINYPNAFVIVLDLKLRNTQDLVPALEIARRKQKPLLVIANDFDPQIISLLAINKMHTGFPVAAIKAPAYGERRKEIMEDIAALTGAEVISDIKGQLLKDITEEQFGTVKQVVVKESETILFVNEIPEAAKQRAVTITEQIKNAPEHAQNALKERLAKLLAKVAVIYVGAATETAAKEIKDRIDDAIRAVRAAIEGGYVAGGGAALRQISASLKSSVVSTPVQAAFVRALCSPYEQILRNAGLDIVPDTEYPRGINALTEEECNLFEAGIIDPTLVIESALTNAVSAASMLLLSEVVVHDVNNKYQPAPHDFE